MVANSFIDCDRGRIFMTLTLPSSVRPVAVPSIMTVAEKYTYSGIQMVLK